MCDTLTRSLTCGIFGQTRVQQREDNAVLKCPTLLRDPCFVDFISYGHPSSLKASFESE